MTFRLYFNRCADWPQIWSIDGGDVSTECNVIGWRFEPGVTAHGARAEHVPDTTREPVAWCAVEADSVTLEGGVAVFRANKNAAHKPTRYVCAHCGARCCVYRDDLDDFWCSTCQKPSHPDDVRVVRDA